MIPAICLLVVAAIIADLIHGHLKFRKQLAVLDARAAAIAEAPCPDLSHIRIIPPDEDLGAELPPADDLFVRMVAALNSFAENNGYGTPVPVLWMAIASVIAEAILGEDLAGLVAGPSGDGGER